MIYHKKLILTMTTLIFLSFSCATSDDIQRIEAKMDKLIQATNRSTMEEIFGPQSDEITKKINSLDESQRTRFNTLQENYINGLMPIQEVREKMINLFGNNDRLVAAESGVYIRDEAGIKIKAIANGIKIKDCSLLSDNTLPVFIKNNHILQKFSWGQGTLDNETILFPWELTMSTFTKEIVQNVARRTAMEFIKMGGNKKWNKPVYIQISVDDEEFKIKTREGENEVYVVKEKGDKNLNEVAVEPIPSSEESPFNMPDGADQDDNPVRYQINKKTGS